MKFTSIISQVITILLTAGACDLARASGCDDEIKGARSDHFTRAREDIERRLGPARAGSPAVGVTFDALAPFVMPDVAAEADLLIEDLTKRWREMDRFSERVYRTVSAPFAVGVTYADERLLRENALAKEGAVRLRAVGGEPGLIAKFSPLVIAYANYTLSSRIDLDSIRRTELTEALTHYAEPLESYLNRPTVAARARAWRPRGRAPQ